MIEFTREEACNYSSGASKLRAKLYQDIKQANETIATSREQLASMQKACKCFNYYQPDYWKVCLDCGREWPGT